MDLTFYKFDFVSDIVRRRRPSRLAPSKIAFLFESLSLDHGLVILMHIFYIFSPPVVLYSLSSPLRNEDFGCFKFLF